jgi:DNA-directed RNA polymerase subunit alpha
MVSIALPKKIEIKSAQDPNQGTIFVEPCYPGYGTTIGNAIRRVLLSSLPGAAVVGVKIKGASHEFMALPHVKEDVLEIVLNLKLLCLKVHSDEIIKLELDVHGEKEVTAKDIKPNSDVEIANKDLILAHITDMAGNLSLEIFVSKGRGYETVENREKKNSEIGYIEIDSIFSPILNVGLDISNVRVGKMTNWEKLAIDVLTDGTITPEEAFYEAVKILISQFNAIISQPTEEPGEELVDMLSAADADENVAGAKDLTDDEEPAPEESKKKRGRPKKSA